MSVWATLALFACMPKTFQEDRLPVASLQTTTGSFNADYDTVWEATMEILSELSQFEDYDENTGYIRTGWMPGYSDYVFKNFTGTRVPEPIQYKWEVQVTADGTRTIVEVVAREQVEKDIISSNLEFRGQLYQWIDIQSSTAKEYAMLKEVERVIESRGSSGGYDYEY